MLSIDKIKKLIKDRTNKKVGLTFILVALAMIFSVVLFPFGFNPIYLFQTFIIVPFIGNTLNIAIWLIVIASSTVYYFLDNFEYLTKKRMIAGIGLLIVFLLLITDIILLADSNLKAVGYNSIKSYYNVLFVDQYNKICTTSIVTNYNTATFLNLGFILPFVFWILGGWGFAPLLFLGLFVANLYFIYVIIFDDFQILWEKFIIYSKKNESQVSSKKTESIDLNLPTQEFELKFAKEQKERVQIIEKVKDNMDTTSYEALSEKIKEERERLQNLKSKVLKKVDENNELNKQRSSLSEERKREILRTLGDVSYTKIKQESEAKKENQETFKIAEKETLANNYINALAEELLINNDQTTEVPLIKDYYNEIFNDEEKLEKHIEETLETSINLEKDTEKDVILEGVLSDMTVEEFISIPESIEKTEEFKTNQEISPVEEEASTAEVTIEHYNDLDISEPEDEEIEYDAEDDEDDEKIRPADWCKPYILPSTSILSSHTTNFDSGQLTNEINENAKILNEVFSSFGIKATVNSFEIGPTVSTFKVELESGVKTSKVTNLEENIKLRLGAEYIRILAPIPGTSFIGIEIPNRIKKPVLFRNVFDNISRSNEGIQIAIGQDVSGKPLSFDLTEAPHLLVAGSTGSGKSVGINTILASILLQYKPTDVQLVLVDPKMVEFAPFHGIPHLLADVVIDAENANRVLQAMVQEMEDRYKAMAENGVKKLDELNKKLISEGKDKKPFIVIVIDELADLMMVAAKEVEESIMRITQKARAAGIHMILATQRPSTEIITGTIKSNIPSRMAFTVASSIDSRTILGQIGAEKLIGKGDMLISLYGKLPFRAQGAWVSNEEIEDITAFVKTQCKPFIIVDPKKMKNELNFEGHLIDLDDPSYKAAKDIVLRYKKASVSMLQRHLNIGYNKAANIIETLENEGVVGTARGSKPREVLVEE